MPVFSRACRDRKRAARGVMSQAEAGKCARVGCGRPAPLAGVGAIGHTTSMTCSRARFAAGGALMAALLGSGCDYPEETMRVPEPSAASFATAAYPVLLRDCGFPACHGDHARFFQVFGPGRARLSPQSMPYDPATPDELALSYARARSMLAGPDGPRSALLLRKPLATSSGGAGHEGDDVWGQPVYASPDDPRWRVLRDWAFAVTSAPSAAAEEAP